MTVKITLEYPTVDLAIVALAKLTKAADTVIDQASGKPTRKGRSDAGKPRKNQGAADAPPEPKAAGPGSPASSTSGTAAGGEPAGDPLSVKTSASDTSTAAGPAASSGPIPAEAEVQKVIEQVFESTPDSATGIQKVKDLLARYGVARGRDLPEDKRAEFIAEATAALPKKA